MDRCPKCNENEFTFNEISNYSGHFVNDDTIKAECLDTIIPDFAVCSKCGTKIDMQNFMSIGGTSMNAIRQEVKISELERENKVQKAIAEVSISANIMFFILCIIYSFL